MKSSKNMFKTKYFLREVTRIMMRHMENLEELLERYNVNYKSFFLDEIESKKANSQISEKTSKNVTQITIK